MARYPAPTWAPYSSECSRVSLIYFTLHGVYVSSSIAGKLYQIPLVMVTPFNSCTPIVVAHFAVCVQPTRSNALFLHLNLIFNKIGLCCCYFELTEVTHLHHLLRLDINHQQSAEERLRHVDVLVPDVDG